MNATILNTTQAQTAGDNKINWRAAILAGALGTMAFDVLGWMLTGQYWDIPSLLAAKLFGDSALLPLGVLAHYGNGLALAIIFAALSPSLWGNRWVRATTFVVAETVFGVYLFMFPLLDLGAFGLAAGISLPLISMARHLAFGTVLALFDRTNMTS